MSFSPVAVFLFLLVIGLLVSGIRFPGEVLVVLIRVFRLGLADYIFFILHFSLFRGDGI